MPGRWNHWDIGKKNKKVNTTIGLIIIVFYLNFSFEILS